MPKGGYRIADLKGTDVPLTGYAKIPGLYNFIEETNGKPLLFTNFKFNGVEQHPAWVSMKIAGGSYQGQWAGQNDGRSYVFVIGPNDDVKLFFTPAVQGAGAEPAQGEDAPSASM